MGRLSFKLAGLTDQGRVRPNNEDAVCVAPEIGLLIVADGMGGHQAGEVASGIAVSTIESNLKRLAKEGTAVVPADNRFSAETNSLGFCMTMANQTIFEAAKERPQQNGMGTTCTAILIKNDRVSLAHVGDSRCYLIRRGELDQLTEDHSLISEQARLGLAGMAGSGTADQNILTRSLGAEEEVKVDLDEHPLFPGDILLLCSDGLGKEMTDAQVLEIVKQTRDPLETATRLIQKAKAAGGRDNITVAVARVEKAGFAQAIGDFFRSLLGRSAHVHLLMEATNDA